MSSVVNRQVAGHQVAGHQAPGHQAHRHQVARQKLTGIRVQAGRGLAWWLGELRSIHLDAARRLRIIARNTLTIEAGERRWIVRRKQVPVGEVDWAAGDAVSSRRLLRELAAPARRVGSVGVEIPPERILSKIIDLPAGAEGELDRVLSFEIARHFPFSAERVFYRYRIVGRSGNASGKRAAALSVEIVAVPREVVVSIADELALAGLRASGVAILASRNAAPLFLSPDALGPAAAAPSASRLLAASVALLALIATASWPIAQQFRLAQIEREITALKPAAEAALRARQEDRRDADQAADIMRLRAQRPPLIALLEALSRELPDGSWLTSLSIAGRDILLEGLTPSAATIALGLGRNPNFGSVLFRSPIARDGTSGLEHFQLGATTLEVRR
jgi:general secretion pathway protein L